MNENRKLVNLMKKIPYRDKQLRLLYQLLIGNNVSYPLIHIYGLSGTGKTYVVQNFMKTFCYGGNENDNDDGDEEEDEECSSTATRRRVYVYLNCNEVCYASKSLMFNEILEQVRKSLRVDGGGEEDVVEHDNDVDIRYNDIDELAEMERELNGRGDDEDEDEESIDVTGRATINDCSMFLRRLRALLASRLQQTSLFLIFDNADRLKYLGGSDSTSIILTLCKLNEYLNPEVSLDSSDCQVRASCLFITEFDWHSLTSEWDLMSKTDAPRPYPVFFSDYSRDEMSSILAQTAIRFTASSSSGQTSSSSSTNTIKFYARIILEVFYPICKDLNEIQYLIQIYYDQLVSSAADLTTTAANANGDESRIMAAWNRMKPFLKQALTQIYLRQSMHQHVHVTVEESKPEASSLSKDFESLNIGETSSSSSTKSTHHQSCNQLPRLMKYILISAYIATHNPAKYDRKLFELGKTGGGRKSRFTAQRFQQLEDNQHAAALKTQAFDLNRLMAIFFAVCAENLSGGGGGCINLSQVMVNLRTLKSLHYLQQSNSTYSSLDEPKFRCLIDFETILGLANSVQFNIKQYLAEYINL